MLVADCGEVPLASIAPSTSQGCLLIMQLANTVHTIFSGGKILAVHL